MADKAIKQVQQALIDFGFPVGPDGVDGTGGANTQAALAKFQMSRGFNATGQLDAKTMAALFPADPVIVNAANAEPWYKSRIYLGLITTVVGFVAAKIGVTVTSGDVATTVDILGQVIQAAGVLYATYGRIVGSKKPPLGAK